MRRLLLFGTIVLFVLSLVPACDSGNTTVKDKSKAPIPDQAPPNPAPAGKPG